MISVLVPWAPAGPEREATWRWNEQRLRWFLPEAEIITAASDRLDHPGVFDRAVALNRAAAKARGDLLLLCDADTTCPGLFFQDVLRVAARGLWSLPARYIRLGPLCSRRWMEDDLGATVPLGWEHDIEQEYPFANSGVVAMPREAFELVGGFDERFVGWGGEDDAMRAALETLWGAPVRVGIAFHLWHPRPAKHSTGQPNSPANFVLADRYGAASGDPEAVRALLRERG